MVYNRTVERAQALVDRFNGQPGKVVAAPLDKLCDTCCDVLINATPIGMHPKTDATPAPERIKTDICIIGAGSGGLSVAAGAVQMGAKVVLLEGHKMGGDCLNTGCVPSKALLAAGKRAAMHRKDDIKGIASHEPIIDYAAVKDHVADTIATIAPHDSPERFRELGVNVILKAGEFVSRDTLETDEYIIKATK